MEGLQKHFEDAENPFHGLDTPYLQLQYCKKDLNLIVCILPYIFHAFSCRIVTATLIMKYQT